MNSKNLHKHAVPVIIATVVGIVGLTTLTAGLSRSYFSLGPVSVNGLLGSAVHIKTNHNGLADVTFRVDNPTPNNYSLQMESEVSNTIPTILAFQNAAKLTLPSSVAN